MITGLVAKFALCAPPSCVDEDGSKVVHVGEGRAGDDEILPIRGPNRDPIARHAAIRMRAFPEETECLPLHRFEQLVRRQAGEGGRARPRAGRARGRDAGPGSCRSVDFGHG